MELAGTLRRSYARFALAVQNASRRRWPLVLIAMLGLLHVAVARGSTDGWARALFLAHLGLVLMWQPFFSGSRRIGPAQTVGIALVGAVVSFRFDAWLLAFWIVVLAGLMGGMVFLHRARWQRRAYLAVLVYLLALLAVLVLPQMAPGAALAPELRTAAAYGLPLLLALPALFPVEAERADAPQAIDFFYSVFLMLALGMVVLGSFTLMALWRLGYLEALTATVFLVAATLFLVVLAWGPAGGSDGLALFFARYLLSIGVPIERWLRFLAELARVETRPERFLAEAVGALARMPWIAGARWEAGGVQGEVGERTPHRLGHTAEDLRLELYSRYRPGPALASHLALLGRLLAGFYGAKLRERELQQASYLQAVHETAAGLAHDVKNLLQSLKTLCAAVEKEGEDPRLLALVRRQLPEISQRLATTLAALERPAQESAPEIAASEWWSALRRRCAADGISFAAGEIALHARLPGALFDTVAENLIANALAKRLREPAVSIRVALATDGQARLRVCDSGSAIPAATAAALFRAPLPSAAGLGIGLYHSARLAAAHGYALALATNRDGEVCFELAPARDQGSVPAAIMRP